MSITSSGMRPMTKLACFALGLLLVLQLTGCGAFSWRGMADEPTKAIVKPPLVIAAMPPDDYQISNPSDSAELITFALKLRDDPLAVEYLLRAAEKAFSRELQLACLAGAAKAALRAGDLQRFLHIERQLEGQLTAHELVTPPGSLLDVIYLARMLRHERLPSSRSVSKLTRLQRDFGSRGDATNQGGQQ